MLFDNGIGVFLLIWNIVINDSKLFIYKVVLLRLLFRIVEGYLGFVIERISEYVVLFVGFVVFYWLKLYKFLVD